MRLLLLRASFFFLLATNVLGDCDDCALTGDCTEAYKGAYPGTYCGRVGGVQCCCPVTKQCAATVFDCRCRTSPFPGYAPPQNPIDRSDNVVVAVVFFSVLFLFCCAYYCVRFHCGPAKKTESTAIHQPPNIQKLASLPQPNVYAKPSWQTSLPVNGSHAGPGPEFRSQMTWQAEGPLPPVKGTNAYKSQMTWHPSSVSTASHVGQQYTSYGSVPRNQHHPGHQLPLTIDEMQSPTTTPPPPGYGVPTSYQGAPAYAAQPSFQADPGYGATNAVYQPAYQTLPPYATQPSFQAPAPQRSPARSPARSPSRSPANLSMQAPYPLGQTAYHPSIPSAPPGP
ncbi:unnamed protein product [Aphanomyces euteiches]